MRKISNQVRLKHYNFKVICKKCKQVRLVSYSQLWMIETGRCSGLCVQCKNSKPNKTSFNKGHKPWNAGLVGYALGEKANNWRGGKTKLSNLIRWSLKYNIWRKSVFQRDDYVCHWCGQRGIILEAHHLYSFADILDKYNIKTTTQANNCLILWHINNGLSLCVNCHNLFKQGRTNKQ